MLGKFNQILQSIQQETKIENRWRETTPRVLVKYPAPFHKKKPVRLTRLGNVDVLEMPNPRTRKRERLLKYGSLYPYKQCDVRLASPGLLEEVDAIDARIDELQERRKALLQDRFWEKPPLSFEDVREANAPWSTFKRTLSRFKEGEASQKELQEAMEKLFPL